MTDNDNKIGGAGTNPLVEVQSAAEQQQSSPGAITGRDAIGQQEFLTLLVNQLQNQDPLNPMESEEFAVQLAQFSQLEQLIDINGKLSDPGGVGGNPMSMMASFLGHEVVLKDQQILVSEGRGPNVLVDVPEGVQGGRVDFITEDGTVARSIELENLESGRQVLPTSGVSLPNGSYEIRVVAVNARGEFETLDSKVTATVEGFVLEPEPALLVNGSQVALEDIAEVYRGNS